MRRDQPVVGGIGQREPTTPRRGASGTPTGQHSKPPCVRPSSPPLRCAHLISVAALAAVILLSSASAAFAHAGEASEPAKDLVLTAVAVLQSQPEQRGVVEDKIHDALDATDRRGVDLELVREAETAWQAGKVRDTEALLVQAVGRCPGAPVIYLEKTPPVGDRSAPCSVPASTLRLAGSGLGGAWEPVLLIAAALLIAAGVVLVRRQERHT